MDHKAFFDQGISLSFDQNTRPVEADIRNAIGRLYYYAYHEALKFVQNNEFLSLIYNDAEFKKKNPTSHKRILKTFAKYSSDSQNLNYGTISRHLGNLHTMRCTADYDLIQVVNENNYFSFIANFESLKQEIIKIDVGSFNVDTKLESENITQTDAAFGKIIVKKKGLRLVE